MGLVRSTLGAQEKQEICLHCWEFKKIPWPFNSLPSQYKNDVIPGPRGTDCTGTPKRHMEIGGHNSTHSQPRN